MSNRACLTYVAGDVTSYQVVKYSFQGKDYTSFFSAHALWSALDPEETVALLPDSLISANCDNKEVVKKAYKDMLTTRAHELQQKQGFDPVSTKFNEFLDGMKVEYIPNVGVGSGMVADCEGNLSRDKDGRPIRQPYSSSRDPTFIYNAVFAVLHRYHSEGCGKFIVDLTHGTNVLVSALLASSALFESDIYAAPVMGSPSGVVEIVGLSNIVEAMKDSLKIGLSIEMMDERYSVDYTGRLRDLNPTEFGRSRELVNRVKRVDLNKVNDFLWNMRNGFVVNGIASMRDLQQYIPQLRQDFLSLRDLYLTWYNAEPRFQKESRIVLSNFSSTLGIEGVLNSLLGKDDIETLFKALEKYIEVEYYDKALSLARELPVAECLSNHGGGTFDDNDRMYRLCEDLVGSYIELNNSDFQKFRNLLMHSGLSKDLRVKVDKRGVTPTQNINRRTIVDYVKGKLKDHAEGVRRIT
ncbi:hypothetical protein GWK48_10475 [Metallosphaera tengchongensis]|uniref:CRISPR system endoribonuclease Csx1 CARF domain-containing protein n=1 Tax=Metallosphaera tengchongensis TaxID=1532350 RepID=A0A6N0NX12_9CREN|nr:TM1812 family CRISPR-associated protein [Metallosphaera tengchongensis]QKR00757.1 hypothetical protein GWK48_10475 [Metallosphaera tengchongensis]